MKTRIPPVLITLALICFAFSPKAQAVVPSPDGGYPNFNTAEGQNALFSLTTGVGNAAVGWYSLFSNTDGSYNTALGAGTLLFNVGNQSTGEGISNTALGTGALLFNTIGSFNTATGATALLNNTSGDLNTASGYQALYSNTSGTQNAANGYQALYSNTAGFGNTANGRAALSSNTEGDQNTADGLFALSSNTTGGANTAIGNNALSHNSAGSFNTAIGNDAGTNLSTASNVICIGAGVGGQDVDNSCYIGNIWNQASPGGAGVFINSDGKLGISVSSRRFKKEINPMDSASESILALKPVTFHYKSDTIGTPQFGLIAEEVAEVNPDLVVRDKNGEIFSVRYEAVNAMLLNEFLKEHRHVQKQDAIIARQQKQIDALTAGLQEVSAQLELNKSAPQTVLNER